MSINKEGELIEAVQAKRLDEVDRRVNHLKREFHNRVISKGIWVIPVCRATRFTGGGG